MGPAGAPPWAFPIVAAWPPLPGGVWGARGCGAIAMAGGSAFARLCAIANLCGQRSTTGEQRRVAEESVSCICEMVPMETILGSDALMFRCSTPISYVYDLTL